MSIAEKLTTIAENVPKVFQAGYDKGKSESGGSGENPLEYATSLYSAYRAVTFDDDDNELLLNVPNIGGLSDACYCTFMNAKGIKKITLKGNVNKNAFAYQSFLQGSSVVEVDFTEYNMIPTTMISFCNGAKQLVSLNGIFDMSQCTNANGFFPDSQALREVRFKENTIGVNLSAAWVPNLSAESVQSIIDGLATVETAKTLTFNSKIALTDTQKNTISSKGWTLVQ